MSTGAHDLARILLEIDTDPSAADQLLPLVYEELRRLAATRLAAEHGETTLEPTDLVHEAYLRLVSPDHPGRWNGRAHFFGAAAQAMRRILVDAARKKKSDKRGRDWGKVTLNGADPRVAATADEMILLDETLCQLMTEDPIGGRLVELRYFAGLSTEQAAEVLGISRATAYRHWSFARAWLHCRLQAMRDS